jgi:hypothetical protein
MQSAYIGLRCALFSLENEASNGRATVRPRRYGCPAIKKETRTVVVRVSKQAPAGACAAWDQCTTIFSW